MSNYIFTARDKETGDTVEFEAIDDYFGTHQYGYTVSASRGYETVYSQEEFDERFEVVKQTKTRTMKTVEDYVEDFKKRWPMSPMDIQRFLRQTLTKAIDQARKEEREKIAKLIKRRKSSLTDCNVGWKPKLEIDDIFTHLTK